MSKIKKSFISLLVFGFIFSVSSANADKNCNQIYKNECPSIQEQKEIQNSANNKTINKACEECKIEDDEYCIYNQCYFDKQYRVLKTKLSPSKNQESCLDNIYLNFKQDLEILCDKYSNEKNKLLEMIALDDKCLNKQKAAVKDIKYDIKEKYKDYLSDTKEVLCKNQKKTFKKFKREQNRKIKEITRYGAIYKFPCP